MISGTAIWCLHDLESSWWQGYFVAAGSTMPWGLLATLEDIDDCLACADGGYRRVTLTVYPKCGPEKQKPYKIGGVDWTGGNMMNLYHPGQVEMTAQQLVTGNKAVGVVGKYFSNLVQQLQQECGDVHNANDDDNDILSLLPDIAVVKGTMSLKAPDDHDDF